MEKVDYEHQALLYGEKYGIIEYLVKGSKMVYRENFPVSGQYKVVVDLKTGKEESRTKYKRKVPYYITSKK